MTKAALSIGVALAILALPAVAAVKKHQKPHSKPISHAGAAAQPAPPPPQPEPPTDLSGAISQKAARKLPSTRDQFDTLKGQIAHDRPAVEDAKQKSDRLKAEALALHQKLVDTAKRVEDLEAEKLRLDAEIARLESEYARLSASFAHDRVSVAKLLAVLERLEHDMPPAIVMRPDDALSAARGAMLIGASVPGVYRQAADLSRRIDAIVKTRTELVARRADGVRNARELSAARDQLDQLVAMKQLEADTAGNRYADLEGKLEKAASTAADLKALLDRIAQLRTAPAQKDIVVVAAQTAPQAGGMPTRSLLRPVAGHPVPGGMDGVGGARAPGLTFSTDPGAHVIAPADSEVLFAGPYHKTGQVLILEMTAGYDLVLAGLGRVDVRPNDEVLAGEPLGTMPKSGQNGLLYFELRQNGRGVNPAPWLAVELRKAQK
jgi:murein hydrolase activator